jgi:spermidine synthase
MKPFEAVASTVAPNGASVTLHRRGEDLFVHLDGEELMSTRTSDSETALAELAIGEIGSSTRPTVLIGGLGLGFTLRAALERLPVNARVVVAELLPAIVEWNRAHLPASRAALADRRVELVTLDVAAVLGQTSRRPFDAILLDVDDGPSAVCFESNLGLYDRSGLERLVGRLASGGVLAVWSAQADPVFARTMRKAGLRVRVQTVRGHRQRGARYTVFLGLKQASARSRGRRR